ncbi:Isoleucine--tRNA ligase [Candidatus Providencia siddallii]|uniref:Isoleucine--tRNA ligase n=1 Tax=Candidatus Providencia siddallii TaxID=1715285 RepID=A0A0M6W6I9_9GAMM|nr:Isoleucine--tRNA ligase [Candidatus Providencia siddallii]
MSDYKETLNLPSTDFQMRANLTKIEPNTLKRWNKENLYQAVRESKFKKKMFILHDGPPYANGAIHIGHSINKILKDIIIKSKGLSGYNSPYIPGWDCHGLPIEHKIENLLNNLKKNVSSTEFRVQCRNYAKKQIKKQKDDFIRLGVLGDWNEAYQTMDFKTEANTIRALSKVIKNGFLIKGAKPVYWCTICTSSLAEAEVEYYNKSSPGIYVKFKAVNDKEICKKFGVSSDKSVSIIIWTTTPWTLPANKAISVNQNFIYNLIEINNELIILASNLIKNVFKTINVTFWKKIGDCNGKSLELLYFQHPFMNINVPIVLSDHVNLTIGTGAVHIAPDHGQEDYSICLKYNLKISNLVDSNGCFLPNTYPSLDGIFIFKANDIIVKLLNESGSLLFKHIIQHSYPHCWRHKTAVIFRSIPQWFICMDKNKLRERLLNEIKNVQWIPNYGFSKIKSMIENRPDWCISRQRVWGVPMPLFVHKKTEELHPRTLELMEEIAKRVELNGIEAWWNLDSKELIGDESKIYHKISDTLDVWFDSGATHFSVVKTRAEYQSNYANLYLEGLDQHRGWFMSSLVLSMIINERAPYNQVLTHGFVVDKQNRKMSKSLGNTISPQEIVSKFGADVLRLWVASTNYTNDISISNEILERIADSYRRIRNTVRFLLSNLNDFDPEKKLIKQKDMIALDNWAISRAFDTQKEIINLYNKYDFSLIFQRIMYFCSIEMSSFYFDIIKDRQYTTRKNSLARRSCQSALFHIAEALVRWIAPVLSFTSDEIWSKLPGKRSKFVFTEEWYDGLYNLDNSIEMNNTFWSQILMIRNESNKILEQARIDKKIKSSLEAELFLYADNNLFKKLNSLENELRFILLTSKVTVIDIKSAPNNAQETTLKGLKILFNKANGKKCPRCWHYTNDINTNQLDICNRCITNVFGHGETRKFA